MMTEDSSVLDVTPRCWPSSFSVSRIIVPLRIMLGLLAVSHPRGLESSGVPTVLLYKVCLINL